MPGINLVAKLSLSFLWIVSGVTSAYFARDIGYDVLAKGGITDHSATFLILSGSLLDFIIGIWLLTDKKLSACYKVQLIVVVAYTFLLTAFEPVYWLNPFGPLTKNIPLLVMIYYLYCKESLNQADVR